MTTSLVVRGVSASYGATPVLRGVDLEVPAGTTTAILGPSGCGKTTLLRVVAGFHSPSAGEVRLGDRVVVGGAVDLPPEKRGIGYVAQEGALFPHLSVADNIAFGLKRQDRRSRTRVVELLELVGLAAEVGERRPDQLSGGQQQRVALARSLARRPALVLLDEPFSSLDAGLRSSTRRAVADALAAEGVTVLLVTHDQGEALSFADQVAIMRDGVFAQVGSPETVYGTPVDRQSAAFLGDLTVVPGTVSGGLVNGALGSWPLPQSANADASPRHVAVRPEHLRLVSGAVTGLLGEVDRVDYFGHDAIITLTLRTPGREVVQARTIGTGHPRPGEVVGVEVAGPVHVF